MTPWRAIVEEHGGIVWRAALRLLGNESDAADCFQETFVCAVEFARGRRVENWAGLLKRIATTRALDALRKRAVRRVRGGAWMDPEMFVDPGAGPWARAENEELAEQLAGALAQLPASQAEVYCLRHLSGMSYEEISRETGISTDAVGVYLHRARARLRQLLSGLSIDEAKRGAS